MYKRQLRESAAGYFDWLLPAVFSYHGRYQVRVVPAEELLDAESRHMTVSYTHLIWQRIFM